MKNNRAYIDGQNLHLGIKEQGWSINHEKFRTYLRDKYYITEAYYFLGYVAEEEQCLYDNLQKAGFILQFREHSSNMKGKKKGNVDGDIIFSVMKSLLEPDNFDLVYLVSGDGDYKKLVDFLKKKDKLGKVLFPNKKFASSLYKRLGGEYFDSLDAMSIRKKIGH